MSNSEKMDKIVSLAKTRGFVYPGSDIYGGLANSWDYGPLGVQLKNNVKAAWWKKFVQESPYNVGLDAAAKKILAIIAAEKCRCVRNIELLEDVIKINKEMEGN